MNIRSLLIVCCLVFSNSIFSQASWVFAAPTDGTGSAGAESARSICTDASGNVYIVGVFNGAGVATDFDLNASFTNLFTASTSDGFIASYDKNGAFRWKTIVTGSATDFAAPSGGICTDGTNVWVAGSVGMTGAPVIASSSNTVVISSVGTGVDAFVSKLNCSNGAVQWAQAFGGSGALDYGEGICVDPSGNCYVSGSYSGVFTLNSISAPAPGGTSDFYIAKFNSTGTLIALNTGGSIANTDMIGIGGGLCYVPGGSPAIVATGHIGASSANFGAFTGLTNSGLNDCFLVELDLSLNFTNALVFGSAGADELPSAVYDSNSGGVFVSGFASGNLTFPGTPALTGLGAQDIILGRYSVASNNFVWSSIAGGTGNDRGWCIATDNLGGIFLSGYYGSPTCAFGGTVSIASNAGLSDMYVTRYNPSGTPIWVQSAGSSTTEEARGIASYVQAVPYQQMLFVTGIYQGPVTIGSTSLGNDGGNDFFLAKIYDNVVSCPTPTLTASGQTNVLCNGGSTASATVIASGGSPFTYTWSPSGGNAATASGLSAGTYTCIATNSCGLTASQTFTITQPSALVTSTAITNVLCNGGNNGSATITASGGTGGYTYLWSSAQTTSVISSLNAGVRTVTVTDANGCTSIKSITITQPSALVTSTAITNVSCNGGSNGSATVTASGGTGAYTYLWSTAATTSVISGQTSGVKTVTVTDANSCTSVNSVNITQPSALVTSTAVTNVLCFGGSTGSATVTASGGTGAYTYLWSTAQTTSVISALNAGVRTVTVTDANGCTSIKSITISQPASTVSTSTTITNILCNGGSNGSATVTASGGTGAYTYLWSTAATTSVISGQTSGVKTVTVTDANGCTTTNAVTITQPSALVTSTAISNVLCNGGTGSATITASGGTGAYTYLWSTAATTSVVTGILAGVYTATVTDANGCTSIKSVSISQPSALTATQSQTNVTCVISGQAQVSASGGAGSYSYTWSPSGGTAATSSALTAGNYSCTIADANNCIIVKTFTITSSAATPTVTISGASSICIGQSITLSASGADTYTWSTTATTSTITQSPTTTVTYSVTGTNTVSGCTNSASQTVTVNTLPVISVNNGTICSGQSFTIIPSGASTYTISGASAVVSPTVTTSYSVTGTSSQGCVSTSTASSNVTVNNLPTVVANAMPSATICTGSSLILFGGGASTYTWSSGVINNVSFTPTISATYTLTGTDANGCQNTAIKSVVLNPLPTVAISISPSATICAGNTITLSGSGASTYNWSGGVTDAVAFTPTASTSYTVTGTDVNGCQNVASQSIVVNPLPVVNATVSANPVCAGSFVILQGSGTAGASFVWQPGSLVGANQSITPTVTATYTLNAAYLGCTNSAQVTVTVNPLPSLSVVTSNTLPCAGQSVTLTASGASSYTWSTSASTSIIIVNPIVPTTYTVSGTNSFGCTDSISFFQNADPCMGITEVNNKINSISIYPNPGNGVFTISGVQGIMHIYNLVGELIFTSELRTNNSEIDLSSQVYYFVRISNTTVIN